MAEDDQVEIEILLKPAGPGRPADISTVSSLKPDPGKIERCRRWFAGRGLTAYSTDFGLVCAGPKALVEEIFGVGLAAADGPPGTPPFAAEGAFVAPAELADLIDSITLPGRPVFLP